MKNKIILLSILAFIIIASASVAGYFLSFKNVIITISSNVSKVSFYKKNNFEDKINPVEINNSGIIRLQKGDYIAVPEGQNIDNSQINFSIYGDTNIKIDPNYSDSYLNSILTSNLIAVQLLLQQKYPELINNYKITNAQLFQKGEWFGGVLVNKNSTWDDIKDAYRFIANKNDGEWKIINYPDLILTTKNYPNIPKNILNTINNIEIEY